MSIQDVDRSERSPSRSGSNMISTPGSIMHVLMSSYVDPAQTGFGEPTWRSTFASPPFAGCTLANVRPTPHWSEDAPALETFGVCGASVLQLKAGTHIPWLAKTLWQPLLSLGRFC
jgi:hypothetical protein